MNEFININKKMNYKIQVSALYMNNIITISEICKSNNRIRKIGNNKDKSYR